MARAESGRNMFKAVIGSALGAYMMVGATAGAQQPAAGTDQALSRKQAAVVPIAAFAAVGDIPRLNRALEDGLSAGLSVSESREVLVQMYAYAGFPRSLNALSEMMKVVEARKARGIQDAPGHEPPALVPNGQSLSVGTANQTRLVGAPVTGPLFDFSPAIDQYLKAHLFGDIFARDNLDWRSRELATLGALSALPGVSSQLRSHLQFSLNVGLTRAQIEQVPSVLARAGDAESARRARTELDAFTPK